MSEKDVHRFSEDLANEPELQEMCKRDSDGRELADKLQEKGYDITPQEIGLLGLVMGKAQEVLEDELDEEQLEQVAGGGCSGTQTQITYRGLGQIASAMGTVAHFEHEAQMAAAQKSTMEKMEQTMQRAAQQAGERAQNDREFTQQMIQEVSQIIQTYYQSLSAVSQM